jgi:hypothetical protein
MLEDAGRLLLGFPKHSAAAVAFIPERLLADLIKFSFVLFFGRLVQRSSAFWCA